MEGTEPIIIKRNFQSMLKDGSLKRPEAFSQQKRLTGEVIGREGEAFVVSFSGARVKFSNLAELIDYTTKNGALIYKDERLFAGESILDELHSRMLPVAQAMDEFIDKISKIKDIDKGVIKEFNRLSLVLEKIMLENTNTEDAIKDQLMDWFDGIDTLLLNKEIDERIKEPLRNLELHAENMLRDKFNIMREGIRIGETKFDGRLYEPFTWEPSQYPNDTIIAIWKNGFRAYNGGKTLRKAKVVVSSRNPNN